MSYIQRESGAPQSGSAKAAPRASYITPGEYEPGPEWIDKEAVKHVARFRERYPMLAKLTMRGNPLDNANLSSLPDTNKFARLADAYNASYRFKPTTTVDISTIGNAGVHFGGDQFEKVAPLETQDQKQMEVFRDLQKDLSRYNLEGEQYYNKEYAERKFNEMDKLVGQHYKELFFHNDEEMRRIGETFNLWRDEHKSEFDALVAFDLDRAAMLEALDRVFSGDPRGLLQMQMLLTVKGRTGPEAQQILMSLNDATIISEMDKTGDLQKAFGNVGKAEAMRLLGLVHGALDQIHTDPQFKPLAEAVDAAIKSAGSIAKFVAAHPIITAAGAGVIMTAADVIKIFANNFSKKIPIPGT